MRDEAVVRRWYLNGRLRIFCSASKLECTAVFSVNVLAAALVFLALVPASLLAGFVFALWLRHRLNLNFSVHILTSLLLSMVIWFGAIWVADDLMVRDCGPLEGKPDHLQWCYWFAAP